jgi:hypothetical protein
MIRIRRATEEALLALSRNRQKRKNRITGDTGKSGKRREGGGGVSSSEEAEQRPQSEETLLFANAPTTWKAGVR